MDAGGGGHHHPVLQILHRQLVAPGVGEGGGLAGVPGLYLAEGQPALHRVQVQPVPVYHQGQRP